MKFSQRIQKNCRASRIKHILAIVLEAFFLAECIFMICGLILSFSDGAGIVMILILMFGGIGYGMVRLIRYSIRRIRENDLEGALQILAPFGDPHALLQAVEDLPQRPIPGIDLRFDETYIVYARKTELAIRRLDQVRYCYDYGATEALLNRVVVLLFAKGEPLVFQVDNKQSTDQILRELYDKTPFGSWIRSGDLGHTYEPFTQVYEDGRFYRLECDGTDVRIWRHGQVDGLFALEELKSCYLVCSPDGDTADDHYLLLYLENGEKEKVLVNDIHQGFRLYMQLLNCAPHLTYGFPGKW